MLSEREAWKYLAELWLNVHNDKSCESYFVYICPYRRSLGLCSCLHAMYECMTISEVVLHEMLKKISAEKFRIGAETGFLWPLDYQGSIQRYEFCETQSRKLASPMSLEDVCLRS